MLLEFLTPEQRARLDACKDPIELHDVIFSDDFVLSEEQMRKIDESGVLEPGSPEWDEFNARLARVLSGGNPPESDTAEDEVEDSPEEQTVKAYVRFHI